MATTIQEAPIMADQKNEGREAFARLLKHINPGRAPGAENSDSAWEDFKAAVAEARAQLDEADTESRKRWNEARHQT